MSLRDKRLAKCKNPQNNLHISEFFRTFAPDFTKETIQLIAIPLCYEYLSTRFFAALSVW